MSNKEEEKQIVQAAPTKTDSKEDEPNFVQTLDWIHQQFSVYEDESANLEQFVEIMNTHITHVHTIKSY